MSVDYISKPNDEDCLSGILRLTNTSQLAIRTLLERYPLINEDVTDTRFRRVPFMIENSVVERQIRSNFTECNDNSSISKLAIGPSPAVPPRDTGNPFKLHRESLPIWKHREEILQAIQKNQIVFIKGDAGCGKTTQIPQFILDNAVKMNKPVRIIASMPKKVAVIAISERVAAERGERVGCTVGYHVKLESRVSPCQTLLTYCTSRILLRSISNLDFALMKTATHLLIDEAHLRDRFTDFIIGFIKELLRHFPKLRLIIVGADDHLDNIALYLGVSQCCQLDISGFRFQVRTKFLDDILLCTNFQNSKAWKDKNYNTSCESSASLRDSDNLEARMSDTCHKLELVNEVNDEIENCDDVFFSEKDRVQMDRSNADNLIENAFTAYEKKPFEEFIDLVVNSELSINYRHTNTGVTMFMAAATVGSLNHVKKLLKHGADPQLKACNGFSAQDFSHYFDQHVVFDYLTSLLKEDTDTQPNCLDNRARILRRYQRDIDEEREHIDLRLILCLIHRIHCSHLPDEGILVFLPGYEEIVTLKHMIFSDCDYQFRDNSIVLYLVHSNMQNGDQRSMFSKPRDGVRKILLATNIVENSLTFDDVVHVIDSGKERNRIYDPTGFSRFKYSFISRSSALQRKGRVGRCQTGYHYCLYSAEQFDMMDAIAQPELLWCSLEELCLQCRELIHSSAQIREFFRRLPDPPQLTEVDTAVQTLMSLGALDDNEELTPLGTHLIDFAIEPRLGKALLYSVVLKCIDPVLTIVSTLAFSDPFVIPDNLCDRKKSFESKKFFSHQTFSDHVATLKAFQEWEKLKGSGTETADVSSNIFCSQNYISSATFEMVYAIRTRLLAQLRASGFVRCKGACDVRELNRYSDNWAVVKSALLAALFPNVAKVDRRTMTIKTRFERNVRLHQSSTLLEPHHLYNSSIPSDWVVYDEMTKLGNNTYIRGCTAISAPALAMFGGTARLAPDVEHITHETFATRLRYLPSGVSYTGEQMLLRINGWIAFIGSKTELQLLLQLRVKFHSLIERQMRKPGVPFSTCEDSVLSTILLMVTAEDQQLGLVQTDGIGQWPKFAGGNLLSAPRSGFEQPERPDPGFIDAMTRISEVHKCTENSDAAAAD